MDESALCADILLTESSSSLRVNENGGIYHLGATFSVVDKHRIGALYKSLQRKHSFTVELENIELISAVRNFTPE